MEQIKNIVLGPKHALRLGDLGRFHRFEAVCLQCRHRTVLDPAALRRRWPNHTFVTELEEKLRCQLCKNADGNTLKTAMLARD